jgi:hypothetical protein
LHVYTPVSEWCDDQSFSASQELIHVGEIHISDGDLAFIFIVFEVETSLLQPLKVLHRLHMHTHLGEKNEIKINIIFNTMYIYVIKYEENIFLGLKLHPVRMLRCRGHR